MLNHPTLDRLAELGLRGMVNALSEQLAMSDIDRLSFEERLGLLVEREASERADRSWTRRLKSAHLRQTACLADIDHRRSRGIDKQLVLELASCEWIKHHHNVVISGATGVGKSFIACALAHKACLEGYDAIYHRLPRLVENLQLSRSDGRYLKLLKQLAHVDVLVLDDWGIGKFSAAQQRDLLELLDDRYKQRSTIVTSQLPLDQWHEAMADPTLADAILDRLVHNAHHIKLKGESMRKQNADLHQTDPKTT